MAAMKDTLQQAAELLGMRADDLLTKLDPPTTSAFSINLPDAASLPTSAAKLITALKGLTVTLHPCAELADVEGDVDVVIMYAVETDERTVNVLSYRWDAELGTIFDTTLVTPLSVIGSITVH